MPQGLFIIFDGNALVHRAYHALPPLTVSKTGEPIGAVYGFTRTLFKVIQEYTPDYWAIAFDRAAPTFRHIQFEKYKAQRPPMPDDLFCQLRRVKQVVAALHLPSFEMDGYEADDILATLACQAKEQGIEAIAVTGDTDILQIVSPGVNVLLTRGVLTDAILYDEAMVKQKYGLSPRQLISLKGLKGDPSDNIPGVSGIGEKTATRLIQQFGSIDEIYRHLDDITSQDAGITKRVRNALIAGEADAREGEKLVSLVRDVPLSFESEYCKLGSYDQDGLIELFSELEFHTLLDNLSRVEKLLGGGERQVYETGKVTGDYRIVNTVSSLDEMIADVGSSDLLAISMMLEHDRNAASNIIGIALSPVCGSAYYLPLAHHGLEPQLGQCPSAQMLESIKPLLRSQHISKVTHNGKECLLALREHNIEVCNLDFDVAIAAYLLGEKFLDISTLTRSKLNLGLTPLNSVTGHKHHPSLAMMSVSHVAQYVCTEADAISRLRQPLTEELKDNEQESLFTKVEMPLLPVLAQMERNGVELDIELLRQLSLELEKQLWELEESIYNYTDYRFNLNSPQQLGVVLFEKLKLPAMKRTKKGYSTDASVLESLRGVHPIIEKILEYRQLAKLKSTYVDALPALANPTTRRIHTSFNQTVTSTGRLSSSNPNLQNIPIRGEWGSKIRCAFVAGESHLLVRGDYSQVELRILAHLSQDTGLLEAFREDADIHVVTATQVFGVSAAEVTPEMRRVAKTVNFGVIYGMSEYGLEQATGFSRGESSEFIKTYFQKYSGVKEFIEFTKEEVRQKGFVQTLLGRKRYIPEINSSNRQVREAAERMAVNMPVQGTAADIIKLAMIRIQQELDEKNLKSRMILQVHDELLFEVPAEEVAELVTLVEQVMSQVMVLSVPLKVDVKVGKNWGEMD